jgi:hypothetical protein
VADPQVHRYDAEIVYVPSDQVLSYAEQEGATSLTPGATYTHRGTNCSFETLIDEFKIDDPAITLLAKVVHGADVSEDRDGSPSRRPPRDRRRLRPPRR